MEDFRLNNFISEEEMMPEQRENYKGKEIIVQTGDDQIIQVRIDGNEVEVARDETSGRYVTSLLPYTDYSSAIDLAKDVSDNVPDFAGG